jgi:hypothetical protein
VFSWGELAANGNRLPFTPFLRGIYVNISFLIISKWFGQKIVEKYGTTGRRFDRERNIEIYGELQAKVIELRDALEMGLGVQQVCTEIGGLACFLAYNAEKGYGDVAPTKLAPEPPPPVTELALRQPDTRNRPTYPTAHVKPPAVAPSVAAPKVVQPAPRPPGVMKKQPPKAIKKSKYAR